MAMKKVFKNKKGISIIELLIVVAVITTAFATLLGIAGFSLKILNSIKETTQANNLAQEAIEAVRNFRDETEWGVDGLGTLSASTDYYPQQTGSPPQWQMTLGEETINIFTRKIVFNNVRRDGNDNIVEAGGTPDNNTKKVTVTVSWKDEQIQIQTYLTNWRE